MFDDTNRAYGPRRLQGCDIRPGASGRFKDSEIPPIDLTGVPMLSDRERVLLGDQTKEGTPEFKRAARNAMHIRDLIRAKRLGQ